MSLQLPLYGLPYALFLFAAVALYWMVPARFRPTALLVASGLFYASRSLTHAALIGSLCVVVWAVGATLLRQPSRPNRALFAAAIALCVAVLAYFKYSRFFVEVGIDVGLLKAPAATSRWLNATVPLGISFFTFEFIHYLADAKRGLLRNANTSKQTPRFIDFASFALFFPTLLAGPIKRFQQFTAAPKLLEEDVAYGLWRMLCGLAKKALIADTAAGMALRLAVPDQLTPGGLWIAMYAYAVQIYFDFSGYSDLAIGAARLFGYRVPENFDWPYLSTSLPMFWRRWHISLSTWIRDYLFIPLGGSRGSLLRTVLNLLVVMALCGLWHGPAWHFVLWGLWHGIGLAATQLFRRRFPPAKNPSEWRRLLCGLLTFHYVCWGWILFATPSLRAAATAFSRMFHFLR